MGTAVSVKFTGPALSFCAGGGSWSVHTIALLPIAVQVVVLAAWLIVRGFSSSPLGSGAAGRAH
jgi:hypothetical protein